MTAATAFKPVDEVTSACRKCFSFVSKSLKSDAKIPANVIPFDRSEPMADHVANTDRRRGVDLGTVLAVIGTLLTVLGMCAGLAGWVFNYVGAIRDTTNQNTQSILYLQQTAGRLEQTQQQNQRDVRDDLHDINGKLDRLLTGSPADQSPSTKKWSRQ
jgi:hypothetical protein